MSDMSHIISRRADAVTPVERPVVRIEDDVDHSRFDLFVDDELVGILGYRSGDGSVEDGSPVLTAPTSRCRGARLRGQPRKHVGQASRLERARQRLDESPVLLLDVPGVALALPTHDFCEGTHDGTGQNEGER